LRLRALAGAYEGAVQADERDGEVPLAELLQEPLRNGYSARPVRYETPFRVLKLTATTTGRFDPRHFKYTDEVFLEDSPFWLAPGDILVQRGNTSEFVGVPAIYEGEPAEFLYPDLMIRVRVRPDVSPRFVWYMLLAPQSRTYLRERATGSAGNMPKINQEILANVTLPRPQIGAQERIVEKLDAAFALGDALERRIDAASLLVERSADAVLAKAFRGELATTDPRTASRSLARGEASSL
jgi:type I restriction enzyme S subunit